MGKPVTVDSDDLEKIIMLTGVTKEMEKLLYKTKNDPFINRDETKIQQAHDRLAGEWRRSTRELHPDHDQPLSQKAFTLLRDLAGKVCHIEHANMRLPLYQELQKKLMIEYGNGHEIIYWSDTKEQQNLNAVAQLMVRVTPLGKKLLMDMATKEQSGIQ